MNGVSGPSWASLAPVFLLAMRRRPMRGMLAVLAAWGFAVTGQAATRTVGIESSFRLNDGDVVVPIMFSALGDEAALSFTVAFDPALIRETRAVAGPGAAGAVLLVNSERASEGLLGVSLAQAPGRSFPAGDLTLVQLTFRADGFEGPTWLRLSDEVLPRAVANPEAEPLPATFLDGRLTVATRALRVASGYGVAGQDVELRLEGVFGGTENALAFSVSYDAGALVLVRAAAGVDGAGAMLLVNTNEIAAGRVGLVLARPGGQAFRAGTNDLVRLRFRAGSWAEALAVEFAESPVATAVADGEANPLPVRLEPGFLHRSTRQLRIPDLTARAGAGFVAPVQVVSTGGESAFAFSLEFDAAALRYGSAELGADAWQGRPEEAQLLVNAASASQGRVGFMIALPPGTSLAAGLREVLRVTLQWEEAGRVTSLRFADGPVRREVSDAWGTALAFEYRGASLASLPAAGPEFLVQPVHQTVNVGDAVTFRVAVSGREVGFQWRKDGLELPGATGSALTLAGVQVSDAGSYSVVAIQATGSLLSQPALLRVRQAPVLVVAPENTTAATRRPAALRVEASGTEPLTYQWIKDGVAIPGATGAVLEFPSVALADAGSYAVVVANAASPGVRSPLATLTVIASPELVRQPQTVTTTPGLEARFEIEATGAPPLSYQWRKNGQNLAGATNAFLHILEVGLADAATYTVVVANAVDTVTSEAAELVVAVTPLAPGDLFSERVALEGGGGQIGGENLGATREVGEPLHAGEQGHRSVWYRWRAPGTPGVLRLSTTGSTFDTLLAVYTGERVEKLAEAGSDDDRGGFFTSELEVSVHPGADYAVAIDGFGNEAGRFVLSWEFVPRPDPVPRIASHPRSTTLAEGATAVLGVVAEGADLRYQWYFQGAPLAGATAAELVLPNFRDALIGDYFVSVQSGPGPFAWSRGATVEIGTDPNVWSVDKVSFGVIPPPPGLRKQGPGGSLWSLAAGTFLYQQRLNTSLTTVSLGESDPSGGIASATRWIGLRALQSGWLVVDTRGSQVDAIVLLYEGPERWPIESAIEETVNGRRRWRIWAREGEEYWVSLDGGSAAQGVVYVNVQLGDLPDPPDEAEPAVLAPALGESLRLGVPAWVRALQPPAALHWLFNGQPMGDWTTNDWFVDAMAEVHQGQYDLVVSNAFGWVGTPVASVRVEVPLQMPPAASGLSDGDFVFQLRGNAGQSYEVLSTDTWRSWQSEAQGWFGSAPVTFRDTQTAQRSQRFFLLRQRPLAVGDVVRLDDGRQDVTVGGGKAGQRYVLERSFDLAQWEGMATNVVRGADWHYAAPASASATAPHFRVRVVP